ncbi:MAG TPA: metallophosphoesterase family protein [Blastocatellia bacterium]|nr:metallophosphoesterase family protein [Blastocatellia bacterium]
MRTIVHLSDIHFGRVNDAIIAPLVHTVNDIRPDVVAVSGDLTQRARSVQFKEARAFLDALPRPQIVVPGNHDIPLHNIFARFAQPLERYRRYITDELRPWYVDDEIAVLGVSTARAMTIKGGRIDKTQVAWLREKFSAVAQHIVKIVVTHHPFDLPQGHDERDLVGRARMALRELSTCGADLFLAGHLHVSHTGHMAKRYKVGRLSSVVVQAGTAASTRGRGEVNSFNVIRLADPDLAVQRLIWQPAETRFVATLTDHFRRSSAGWSRL